MTHTCTRHEPGSPSCYTRDHCRCPDCTRATNRAKKSWRAGYHDLVDAAPARAHLEGLHAIGYTDSAIGVSVGVSATHITYVRTQSRKIHRSTADAILSAAPATIDSGMVSADGTRRRLHALAAIGWPLRVLDRRLGASEGTCQHCTKQARVYTSTAAKIARLYDELWDAPGPSQVTRRRAAAAGWAVPMAWDDQSIDNPDAEPWRAYKADRRRIDLIEDAADLGRTVAEVAAELGVQPDTVYATCRRYDELDLWERLTRQEAS